MQFFEKILFEGLTFKTEKSEDNIYIYAIESKEKIGKVDVEIYHYESGKYWFEDIMDEDEYDEMFQGSPFAMINHIEIVGGSGGNGVGTALMNKALERIKKLGLGTIVLNACPLNRVPLSTLTTWYEKFGFKIYKHQGGNAIMIKKS